MWLIFLLIDEGNVADTKLLDVVLSSLCWLCHQIGFSLFQSSEEGSGFFYMVFEMEK